MTDPRALLADLLSWAVVQLGAQLDDRQTGAVRHAIAVLRGQPLACPLCGAHPGLVNQRQAAAALGVSTRTLRRHTAAGALPAVHIGRRTLYDLEAIRADPR